MLKPLLTLLTLLTLLGHTSAVFAADLPPSICAFETVFSGILGFALGFAGLAMFIMFIIGGYKWLTAGTNEKAVQQARSTFTLAILGLALTFLAWFALLFIEQFTGIKVTVFQIPNCTASAPSPASVANLGISSDTTTSPSGFDNFLVASDSTTQTCPQLLTLNADSNPSSYIAVLQSYFLQSVPPRDQSAISTVDFNCDNVIDLSDFNILIATINSAS